jgi:hypothetical protein
MSKITSAIAATLIASSSFATAALAAGDYYEGANPPSAGIQHPAGFQTQAQRPGVSYGYTGSVVRTAGSSNQSSQFFDGTSGISRGDYYEGANRPN